MNTKDALALLIRYLKKYSNNFILHPDIIGEFKQLLKKDLKGNEDAFFNQLITQLNHIMSYKKEVNQVSQNEILSNVGNDTNGDPYELYSIHIDRGSSINIRLIISFNKNETPLLLTVFNERGGKRRTDYTEPIKKAKKRKDELTKGDS